MKTIEQKRLEFLEETIAHFNINNRGLNAKGDCSYTDGCAIGRHLPKELCEYIDQLEWSSVGNPDVISLLPADMQKLGTYFLVGVQALHGNPEAWDTEGLTDAGKSQAQKIRNQYCI